MLDDFDKLPPDVRARIEQKLIAAEHILTAADADLVDVVPPPGSHVFFLVLPRRRSELIACPTVLDVVAEIVTALGEHARTYHWSASRLRSTVERVSTVATRHLFDQFRLRPATPFDAFRDEVWNAARATSWWLAYLQLLEERSVAVIPFGVQLQEQLDDLGWEVGDLADRAKVDDRTVERQIAGTQKAHRTTIDLYETIISAEKQEDFRFIRLPKRPKPKRPKTPAKRRPKRR